MRPSLQWVLGGVSVAQAVLVVHGISGAHALVCAPDPAACAVGWRDARVLMGGFAPFVCLLTTLAAFALVRRSVLAPVGALGTLIHDMARGTIPAAVPPLRTAFESGPVSELHDAVVAHWASVQRHERDLQRREQAERLLTLERKVLGVTVAREPLSSVLAALCLGMDSEVAGAVCTILLVSRDGRTLRPGAAPGLSPEYYSAFDGIVVEDGKGCCGTAIHRREVVVARDIATDPKWVEYRDIPLKEGLRACWSVPIMAADGRPLGAFATYFRTVREPEDWMLDLARRAARLATLAISAEQAADELERAKASAEQANRTKTQFLANMSHELRTPLNAIIGFAEVLDAELQEHPAQAVNASYAADIVASGRHLLAMINDILDVSKMEAGKVELRERICDVPSLLAACERIARARALEKHIDLQVDKSWDMPMLMADDVKIRQILLNLLSNAVKFTPAGGKVSLSAGLNPQGQLYFRVCDNGIGISPADLDTLFVPFHQVDNVYTRAAQGTGLGLALSKGLAEMHGGWLDVESQPGIGTSVILTLPHHRLIERGGEVLAGGGVARR